MTMVQFLMSMGNWSVSQPRSGDPVLASMEPRRLYLQDNTDTFLVPPPDTATIFRTRSAGCHKARCALCAMPCNAMATY